jgi:hypothetical protein
VRVTRIFYAGFTEGKKKEGNFGFIVDNTLKIRYNASSLESSCRVLVKNYELRTMNEFGGLGGKPICSGVSS